MNSQPALPLLVFSGVMFCGAIAGALLPKDTRGEKLANEWHDDSTAWDGALAERVHSGEGCSPSAGALEDPLL